MSLAQEDKVGSSRCDLGWSPGPSVAAQHSPCSLEISRLVPILGSVLDKLHFSPRLQDCV